MKKILAMTLFVIFILTCLVSCDSAIEEEYFQRTNRNSIGRLSVSLSTLSKDGTPLSQEELKKIYTDALDTFTKAYEFLSDSSELTTVNAEADVVLDTDKELIQHIKTAFGYSDMTEGLYQPCGGTVTELFEKGRTPDEKQLKKALSHIGCDKIEIAQKNIKKSDPLCKLDLYAYCDGYALSRVCEFLKDTPVAYGTVTFNGIAGVFGKKPEDKPFAVEIGNGDDGIFNITDGYVALVTEGFGSSYDFSDGILDPALEKAAVYSPDARTAAVVASVGYAHGSDIILELYENKELKFEAVLKEKDGNETFTEKADNSSLYTPITTALSE